MLLSDNELVYINASGMQRARLGDIAKVSRENGELVISSSTTALIRGAIKADKETLSNFFSQVKQVAAWSRERRTVIMDNPNATPMDSSFMGRAPDNGIVKTEMPDPIGDMPLPEQYRPMVSVNPIETKPMTPPPPPVAPRANPESALGRGMTAPRDEALIALDKPKTMSAPRLSEANNEPIRQDYAGFWMRFLAYIIDAIVLGIAGGIISNIFTGSASSALTQLATNNAGSSNSQEALNQIAAILPGFFTSAILATAAITILTWLYYAMMESSERQGTLGKMALGLVVTDANNKRISFVHATGRYFAKSIISFIMTIVTLLSLFPLVGTITNLVSSGGNSSDGLTAFYTVFGGIAAILGIGSLANLIAYVMAGFTARKQALHDMIAKTLVYRK